MILKEREIQDAVERGHWPDERTALSALAEAGPTLGCEKG